MTTLKIVSITLIATCFSCGQTSENVNQNNLLTSVQNDYNSDNTIKSNQPDTSNQDIYDFMKIVIVDQQLDLSYGLTLKPENGCDLSKDDETFLKTLLIAKTKQNTTSDEWRNVTVMLDMLPKCLTKTDLSEMLLQKENLSKFAWDNSRLGFNVANNNNWYSFSIPLFSKDKKTVVMMIRELCTGLCGMGKTIVFRKVDNKWKSTYGGQWMH